MSDTVQAGQLLQAGQSSQPAQPVPAQSGAQPVVPAGNQPSARTIGIADQVGAHLTALTLRGMQFAATQLLGQAPMPVLRQFKMWRETGKNGLPRVFVAYYSALEPLGLGRPSHPAIPVIELLLYAEISDSKETKAALKAALVGSKRAMAKGAIPTPQTVPGLTSDHAVTITELVSNVKNFWRLYAKICQQVRDYVIAGDLHSAIVVFRREELEIKDVIDRIETSATALANMFGRTSRGRIDAVLGPLLLPGEYTQPNLSELTAVRPPHVVQNASLTPAAAPVAPAPIVVTPQAAFEQTTELAQITPKPEPTAISTSFDVEDDVDAAALAFVHKSDPGIQILAERRAKGESTSLSVLFFIGISLVVSVGLAWYMLFAYKLFGM